MTTSLGRAPARQDPTAHRRCRPRDGKVVDPQQLKDLLHDVIRPGDRVALEGDNQKQADFLSAHAGRLRSAAGCTTCTC